MYCACNASWERASTTRSWRSSTARSTSSPWSPPSSALGPSWSGRSHELCFEECPSISSPGHRREGRHTSESSTNSSSPSRNSPGCTSKPTSAIPKLSKRAPISRPRRWGGPWSPPSVSTGASIRPAGRACARSGNKLWTPTRGSESFPPRRSTDPSPATRKRGESRAPSRRRAADTASCAARSPLPTAVTSYAENAGLRRSSRGSVRHRRAGTAARNARVSGRKAPWSGRSVPPATGASATRRSTRLSDGTCRPRPTAWRHGRPQSRGFEAGSSRSRREGHSPTVAAVDGRGHLCARRALDREPRRPFSMGMRSPPQRSHHRSARRPAAGACPAKVSHLVNSGRITAHRAHPVPPLRQDRSPPGADSVARRGVACPVEAASPPRSRLARALRAKVGPAHPPGSATKLPAGSGPRARPRHALPRHPAHRGCRRATPLARGRGFLATLDARRAAQPLR